MIWTSYCSTVSSGLRNSDTCTNNAPSLVFEERIPANAHNHLPHTIPLCGTLLISICCSVQDIRIRGLGLICFVALRLGKVKPRPAKVYAWLKIFLASFDKTFAWKVSCWDSQQLQSCLSKKILKGRSKRTLLPLPNPWMTSPLILKGKGCSGPEGPAVRIFKFLMKFERSINSRFKCPDGLGR